MKHSFRGQQGFTLLEILLVVAAIGILAGIVILAINPVKQLGDTRNAQRRADVNTVLNAVYQYSIDNNGNLPSAISASSTMSTTSTGICTTGTATATCATLGLIDLTQLTTNEKYLTALPQDPSVGGVGSSTGYKIMKTANGRVTVQAPNAEQSLTITVTR